MALSGTVTFRTNRDEVIKGALRLCSAYDFENSAGPTTNQITLASEGLNLLVKTYAVRGLQLWLRKWGVIFPQYNQGVYSLGTPGQGGDHSCLSTPLGVGGFVATTLSSAGALAATTISVTSISSPFSVGVPAVTISNTYNIGIVLDSGVVQWTTVNGTPSGTTVTLSAALTGAASAGNAVYCYQTKLSRPLRILDAFTRTSNQNDIPVQIISLEQYNRFGNKTSLGVPTQLAFDRQVNSGSVYTYPVSATGNMLLFIQFEKQIDDLTLATDDYEMPQEWGTFLKFKLAQHLAPEYEVPDAKFKQIVGNAQEAWIICDGADQENASVFMMPNTAVMYS